jgi:hypothetical protein
MPTDHNDAKAHGDIVDHPHSGPESEELGYETTDVNAGGIMVFLGGLFGFVIAFFFLCFFMGKMINNGLAADDGPTDKWHQHNDIFAGARANGGTVKGLNLKSNFAMEQDELGKMTQAFPTPRLDIDDGNQATADLHAREDLLLEHYSSTPGQPGIRIPIERAMELIAEKGLPVSTATTSPALAEDKTPVVSAPLTIGFARTGYELTTIEARKQKMDFEKAPAAAHAELKPIK